MRIVDGYVLVTYFTFYVCSLRFESTNLCHGITIKCFCLSLSDPFNGLNVSTKLSGDLNPMSGVVSHPNVVAGATREDEMSIVIVRRGTRE